MKISYYRLSENLGEKLAPVYVIAGDQDLLRELAMEEIRVAAVGTDPSPFNVERFDGEDADGEAVVMAANQFPLLGGRRAVLVRRASELLKQSQSLLDYLKDPSLQSVLVLQLEKKPDRRRKSWKEVEKLATVVECDVPRSAELEEWVSDQARARGLRLGREEIRYLITEFGSDLRKLSNEIEKLSLYAGEEKLDVETMATVLGRGKAQHIFKFIDAVTTGEARAALRQLGRLLDEGEPPLRILALLDRLLGQLRIAAELRSSGAKGPSLAKVLGIPPYAAKGISAGARRFDRRRLDRAVRSLADTDRILKSSRLPARLVLESLVISLCESPGGGGRSQPAPKELSWRLSRDL